MNQLEDLVRAAQAAQADRAAPADRVRAALPALARRRRRQRQGVAASIVAAAVVAVAVGVPVLAGRSAGQAPVAPRVTAAAVPTSFALGYQPTWVPSSYVESERQLDTTSLLRVWTKQGADAGVASGIRLTVYPAAADQDPDALPGLPTAAVNGVTGYWVRQSSGARLLSWRPAAHVSISLVAEGSDVSQSEVLRMARSIRPDDRVSTVPLRLPRVPAGLAATVTETSGSRPADWGAQITLAGPGRRITVTYGSYPDAPRGGTTYTIADRPARRPVATDPEHRDLVYLVVDWGNGDFLTLEGSAVAFDDLTEIAYSAQTSPAGLDWIGR
jgi:hypothetical protein